jgi:hypothetical protein
MTQALEKSVYRWTEIWFKYPSDAVRFGQMLERRNSTIVASVTNRIVFTNASGADIRRTLAGGRWEGRHILGKNVDMVDKAAEDNMFAMVGNLVQDKIAEAQDFMENPMGTPAKAALAIGGGVGIALAVAYFWSKNAAASAPVTPPPPGGSTLTPTSLLQNPGATPGKQVFAATVGNSGQTIAMTVGDTLTIVLPNTPNSGWDWLSPYAGQASGVNSPYPGLNRTNPTPGAYTVTTDANGNMMESDNYQAASATTPVGGTVQMLYQLLPVGSKGVNPDANGRPQSFVDSSGNAVTPRATFFLNYSVQ